MINATQSALKRWVTDVCHARKWSPTRLAREAGLAATTLTRLVNDPDYKGTLNAQSIAKIAAASGISPPRDLGIDESRLRGFGEPEVEPIEAPPAAAEALEPGQSLWRVTESMQLPSGYLPGDRFVLDQTLAPRDGDHVVAQIHDFDLGAAETVLRVHQRNFLVPANPSANHMLYIDGHRVVVMGVVTRSWRERR